MLVGAFSEPSVIQTADPPTLSLPAALTAHVVPVWGAVRLVDVAHADVQSWVSALTAAGQSPGSVHKIHRVMSMVLDLAVRDGRLPRNPAVGAVADRLDEVAPSEGTENLADSVRTGEVVALAVERTAAR